MSTSFARYALRYADLGLPVFPLAAREKKPLFPAAHPLADPLHGICKGGCGRVGHGFHDATTDTSVLSRWWADKPMANIACPPPKGYMVLDLENEDALRSLFGLGYEIPETVWATTSEGRHYWLRHSLPEDLVQRKIRILPDVDLIFGDGYVVLPPSVHPSGVLYEWQTPPKPGLENVADAPAWVEELLRAAKTREAGPPRIALRDSGGNVLPFQSAAGIFHGVPEGARDNEIFKYASRLRSLNLLKEEAEVLVLKVADSCSPPFPHSEALKCLWSAWKFEGGKSPEFRKVADSETELEAAGAADGGIETLLGEIIPIEVLMATKFEPIRWIVPDLISEGLTILAAGPKIGKSWFALNLALAVCSGGGILGKYRATVGSVLYLDLEQSPRKTYRRINALPGGNWKGVNFIHRWPRLNEGGLPALETWLTRNPTARLVVIDVLAKVKPRATGKRNIYDEEYEQLSELKQMADRFGIACVAVHHDTKNSEGDEVDKLSGSRAISGVADTVLYLSRKRGSSRGVLFGTGREIEDRRDGIRFDGVTKTWILTGKIEEGEDDEVPV